MQQGNHFCLYPWLLGTPHEVAPSHRQSSQDIWSPLSTHACRPNARVRLDTRSKKIQSSNFDNYKEIREGLPANNHENGIYGKDTAKIRPRIYFKNTRRGWDPTPGAGWIQTSSRSLLAVRTLIYYFFTMYPRRRYHWYWRRHEVSWGSPQMYYWHP